MFICMSVLKTSPISQPPLRRNSDIMLRQFDNNEEIRKHPNCGFINALFKRLFYYMKQYLSPIRATPKQHCQSLVKE